MVIEIRNKLSDAKIKKILRETYDAHFNRGKYYCPKSIVYIVEQFINKKWITDVDYYYSTYHNHVAICGKTNKHHDVFYRHPLVQLLFRMGCHVLPNKHCESILGKGYIVIHLTDKRGFISAEGKAKGIDALAQVVNRLILEAHRNNNNNK